MSVAATLQAHESIPDKGGELSRTTTLLLAFATLFVGLRFWARYISNAGYGADDWMIVAALAFVFVLGALNYAGIAHGLGRHADTVSTDDLVAFFKILLAFECIYITTVLLVKFSLLQMYLRIFPLHWVRVYLAIIGAIIIGWWIAILVVCIFQCRPISKAWLPWIEGTCINLKASFIGNAIPNILTDVAVLCMPIRPIWKLHATIAQRLSLCFILLLGSFVLFASIYRFTTLMQFHPNDTTWTLATACTWCVVEVACGVISVCLPTLRPLMVKISRQFGSLTNSKSAQSDANNGSLEPTELVTIGGTDWSKSREKYFQRMQNKGDNYGVHTTVTRSEPSSKETGHSDTELSLNGVARVTVQHDVDVEAVWAEERGRV